VELEGLPPPPAGLTPSTACEKGEGFEQAGHFADAIKWLLWGGGADWVAWGDAPKKQLLCRVLTSRASCYKEAGEMKKAVADFTQVSCLYDGMHVCTCDSKKQGSRRDEEGCGGPHSAQLWWKCMTSDLMSREVLKESCTGCQRPLRTLLQDLSHDGHA